MTIDRRTLLRGLPSAVALPYLLRSDQAHAAITITRVGAFVELGATQPGGKSQVALSPFDDGTYASGWINTRAFGSDVRAFVQKRARNGAPLSPAIQMGGGALTDGILAGNVSIVTFPNDTSLVFFSAQRNGASATDAFDIFVQRMSASFEKVGAPLPVNAALVGAQSGVFATRLKNGNVQVVWESAPGGFGSPSIIRGRIIKSNGQAGSPERTVIRTTTGFNTPRALVPGPNGGSVLSYTRVVTGGPDGKGPGVSSLYKIRQQLKLDATYTGPATVMDTATDASQPCGAAGLMWSANPNTPDNSAYVPLFTPSGNVSPFHRFNFDGGAPTDDLIANVRIDRSFPGACVGANWNYKSINYDFVALQTLTAAGKNTLTLVLVRTNGSIAAKTVDGPFEPDFMNLTVGTFLNLAPDAMPEYLAGLAIGNTFSDDSAKVGRYRLGYGY